MKYTCFEEIYSEYGINEEVSFSSDETADTTLLKGEQCMKQNKWENKEIPISKNFKIKKRNSNLHEELSIFDDFKIILYGCIGIRTYKMFCYI
ncbi:conserved Plasmodium protein, unknown function [Plasmodium gallinaceum]|uniref:Uncharacterized protein n=1 Tax=Plasmodium gallinaceum TaxID=5849 RepID=A0A1J1GKT4_PLAGA|nr:conserved Plasmodium protein, unknown function [Plasmodium gallinaceum]CRG92985.1 conserved Plasmodium protein, unknown function [Plasmodium gallinaceum]